MLNTYVKKTIALMVSGMTLSILSTNSYAQGDPVADAYLKDIDSNVQPINSNTASINANTAAINNNTASIKTSAADIDQNSIAIAQTLTDTNTGDQTIWAALYWIQQLCGMIFVDVNAWILQDNSKPTASLQTVFSNLITAFTTDQTSQNNMQLQMMKDVFVDSNGNDNAPASINDISYTTLLNQPYYQTDPRSTPDNKVTPQMSAYAYIKNAAAFSMPHIAPGGGWRGSSADQATYNTYYNTVQSIQSFNAYVMSQIYAEYNNGFLVNNAEQALLTQATGSSWFSTIASENIGYVLRQLLMFTSQTFVLLTKLLDTENKILQAQAMTNSMLILNGATGENLLLQKASGKLKS